LLNRITDCTIVIEKIMYDLERYDSFKQLAFGDNPQDAPKLSDTLEKIQYLRSTMSDYSQSTSLDNLTDATDRIEQVLMLMNSIAAKSPRNRVTAV
jgi:hypothetical protein